MSMKPELESLTKGYLEVVKNPHADGPSKVEFHFNPTKISTTAQAKWEQPTNSGSKKSSVPTYKGAEPQSMELELILNQTKKVEGKSKVEEDIATLISWTQPTASTRTTKKPNPPLVQLKWGADWFMAYVASVKTTINMFDEKGHALRATVNVSLKEIPKDDKGQNPTSGSLVGHQSHSVLSGDTLASVAQRYYEKPAYWRGIARANGIDDPRNLRPGTRLYLPPLTDVAASS